MAKPRLSTIKLVHRTGEPGATMILNRPERLNAISRTMLREIVRACRWFDDTAEIKVVVVRGEGRAFSAGFDLGDFQTSDDGGSPRDNADLGRLATNALADCRPLTIAAVHGHCVGGGVVFATACDLRLGAESALFRIPEVDLGIPLAWGAVPRLVREIGPALAKELILTCRPFDSVEARQFQFLNRVVADDELVDAANELAHQLAAKPGFALRITKEHVNAIAEEMAGTRRAISDADTLVTAQADEESRAIARAYLRARSS